jgi:hypothetical protein
VWRLALAGQRFGTLMSIIVAVHINHREEFDTISKGRQMIGLSMSSHYYKAKVSSKEKGKQDADLSVKNIKGGY